MRNGRGLAPKPPARQVFRASARTRPASGWRRAWRRGCRPGSLGGTDAAPVLMSRFRPGGASSLLGSAKGKTTRSPEEKLFPSADACSIAETIGVRSAVPRETISRLVPAAAPPGGRVPAERRAIETESRFAGYRARVELADLGAGAPSLGLPIDASALLERRARWKSESMICRQPRRPGRAGCAGRTRSGFACAFGHDEGRIRGRNGSDRSPFLSALFGAQFSAARAAARETGGSGLPPGRALWRSLCGARRSRFRLAASWPCRAERPFRPRSAGGRFCRRAGDRAEAGDEARRRALSAAGAKADRRGRMAGLRRAAGALGRAVRGGRLRLGLAQSRFRNARAAGRLVPDRAFALGERQDSVAGRYRLDRAGRRRSAALARALRRPDRRSACKGLGEAGRERERRRMGRSGRWPPRSREDRRGGNGPRRENPRRRT